jgi:cytochrome b subunit of formate dehydrogenase
LTTESAAAPHHQGWVRASHWIIAAALLVLVVTGVTILMVHPRLYWGETGNDLTPAFLELKISRNYQHGGWAPPAPFFQSPGSPISAVRTYDIFNQNGWARSLHFLSAWWLAIPGVLYLVNGLAQGHFRWPQYGRSQKLAYRFIVFVAAPLMVLTGMTMAPAVTAAMPFLLRVFGGYQSARTIHFFTFVVLLLFTAGHVVMVIRSGFKRQMRGMTLGR